MIEAIARTFLFLVEAIIKPLIKLADWLYSLLPDEEAVEPRSLQESLPDEMWGLLNDCSVSFVQVNERTACLIASPIATGFVGFPFVQQEAQKEFTLLMTILQYQFEVSSLRIEEPGYTIVANLDENGVWHPRSARAIADA